MANIVYYDQVIWEVKFKLSNETNEITEEEKEKLFPVASLTKVITVSARQSLPKTQLNQLMT